MKDFSHKLQDGRFYFVRHGETDWNQNNILMGSSDIPLNDFGKTQALRAALVLKEQPKIDAILTSPLKRAYETAKIIQEKLDCDLLVLDDLKECCFGELEGVQKSGEVFFDWERGGPILGAESIETFKARSLKALSHVLTQKLSILVVSHGGVWRQWIRFLTGDFHDIENGVSYFVEIKQEATSFKEVKSFNF